MNSTITFHLVYSAFYISFLFQDEMGFADADSSDEEGVGFDEVSKKARKMQKAEQD